MEQDNLNITGSEDYSQNENDSNEFSSINTKSEKEIETQTQQCLLTKNCV